MLSYLMCFCGAVTLTRIPLLFHQCLPVGWDGVVAGGFHSVFANEQITTLNTNILGVRGLFFMVDLLVFLNTGRTDEGFQQAHGDHAPISSCCMLTPAAPGHCYGPRWFPWP